MNLRRYAFLAFRILFLYLQKTVLAIGLKCVCGCDTINVFMMGQATFYTQEPL